MLLELLTQTRALALLFIEFITEPEIPQVQDELECSKTNQNTRNKTHHCGGTGNEAEKDCAGDELHVVDDVDITGFALGRF